MNWDAIGAIAEMLGTVAVLVTLVYLAFQIKQSNTHMQSATAQSQADNQVRWMADLAKDPKLFDLYRTGLKDDEALSKEDRGRFDLIVWQLVIIVDAQYQKYKMGAIRNEQLEVISNSVMPILGTPGGMAAYKRQRHMLSAAFRTTLDELMESSR